MPTNLYTATVTAVPGSVKSSDDELSVNVHEPTELGGPGGSTNPEQLMAAALASCLIEALRIAAGTAGETVDGAAVEASVTLSDTDSVGYSAGFSLRVSLPDSENPNDTLSQAMSICPFLKAVEGVNVALA